MVLQLSLLPSASDYYQLDDLLTPEEQAIRRKVRKVMEKEVAPVMTEVWNELIAFINLFLILLK